MLPSDTVGQLTTYRRALVRNKHLSEIAASIGLKHLIRRSGKMDLHEESLVRFAANCLEAIFGAVFLDGGFEEVDKLIARLFFPKEVSTNYMYSLNPYGTLLLTSACIGSVPGMDEGETAAIAGYYCSVCVVWC